MRFQTLFGRTLRNAPADADAISHQLLLRAAMIRAVSAGRFAWLPLGQRVLRRLIDALTTEMAALSAQEVGFPDMDAADALRLVKDDIASHRDLPAALYAVGPYADAAVRSRGGLLAARHGVRLSLYGLHPDAAARDTFRAEAAAAFERIFAGIEITPFAYETASGGAWGIAHDLGDDRVVACDRCDYAADVRTAVFRPESREAASPEAARKVETPGCTTIQAVADFFGVPTSHTLKAVFFVRDEAEFVFVVIRGDLDVCEAKLLRALGGGALRPATDAEIRAVGAAPGYASPVGLRVRRDGGDGITVVADASVVPGVSFIAGANADGYHLAGVDAGRDFQITLTADIAEAVEGAICARCGEGRLAIRPVLRLGEFTLPGAGFAEAAGATFLDGASQTRPVWLAGVDLRLERLIAAVVEAHHDDDGILWPRSLAPFDVHIVTLGKDETYHAQGRALHDALAAAGVAVLIDDRAEGAGVKFNDADLLGIPLRITVGKRAVERGALEAKWRGSPDRFDVPLDDAVDAIIRLLA